MFRQISTTNNPSSTPNMEDSKSELKDKGYAWVICYCCSLSLAIGEGVGLSFGVLIPKIQRQMGCDVASTALIGSLHLGMASLPAPLYMSLTKKYGTLRMAMVGVSLFGFGILVCGIVTTPAVLTVFYGAVSGMGMGLKHTVEKFTVNMYFDKRRALANSIFHCGSPIGQALFLCEPFLSKKENVHLFSSSLPRFDKYHETPRIFPRTEQTFASARSFGVIS